MLFIRSHQGWTHGRVATCPAFSITHLAAVPPQGQVCRPSHRAHPMRPIGMRGVGRGVRYHEPRLVPSRFASPVADHCHHGGIRGRSLAAPAAVEFNRRSASYFQQAQYALMRGHAVHPGNVWRS
jgi:hypothetical protein